MKSGKRNFKTDPAAPRVYQIRLEGHLGRQWTEWFDGLTITLENNGDTVLTGPVVDQAALHGLLRKVSDLGIPLLSVNQVTSDPEDVPDLKQ
ncbi:MAG: hypothetical protein WBL25_21880 [Anaerolineales bacterium]